MVLGVYVLGVKVDWSSAGVGVITAGEARSAITAASTSYIQHHCNRCLSACPVRLIGNNVGWVKQKVKALKARAQLDKETIAKLKDVNDTLREELRAMNNALNGQVADTGSTSAICRERIVYLPKEKKCTTFTGDTSATFYEWLDELNATLSYRPFTGAKKAAFIHEQLGGEARQEIKHQPQAVQYSQIQTRC